MHTNEVVTNSPLNKLKFTKGLYEMMWDAKEEYLIEVAQAYEAEEQFLKETLYECLKQSKMNMGACNVAVGFLITSVESGEFDRDLKKEIRNQILSAAIYYANGLGLNPN